MKSVSEKAKVDEKIADSAKEKVEKIDAKIVKLDKKASASEEVVKEDTKKAEKEAATVGEALKNKTYAASDLLKRMNKIRDDI